MTRATETCQMTDRYQNSTITAHLRKKWPLWTWAALILLVNLPLFWGEVNTGLLYLPDAVTAGQWWRVITYPLVHLSWYHLLLDAGGFLLLYSCLEEKRRLAKTLYITGAGAGTLFMALALAPNISQQGLSGLSGIAHGLMAISAMEMIRHEDQRTWGYLCLAVVTAKSAFELWSGQVMFEFMHMGLCGHPLAASHAGGVLGGLLIFIVLNAKTEKGDKPKHQTAKQTAGRPRSRYTVQTLLQTAARMLTRLMYRVRYEGLDHIPGKGPAVLVCNHVSYVDWLIIAGACKRPVHFVMHAEIYRLPLLHWLLRLGKVIPIDSGRKNPAVLHQAFKKMAAVLESGGLLCLFPEGHLTRTGRIDAFRPGIEKIIQRNPVPVIPLALRGLWGSFFSHKGGPAMRRWPKKIKGKVELAAGRTILPHQATATNLRCLVKTLRGDMA